MMLNSFCTIIKILKTISNVLYMCYTPVTLSKRVRYDRLTTFMTWIVKGHGGRGAFFVVSSHTETKSWLSRG